MLKVVSVCILAAAIFLIVTADTGSEVVESIHNGEDTSERNFDVDNEDEVEEKNRKVLNEFRRNESLAITKTPLPTENEQDVLKNQSRNIRCGDPPKIDGTIVPDLEGINPTVGTTIIYQCDFGYVSRSYGGFPSNCTIDKESGSAKWTIPDVLCVPRSCGDPGYVVNARRRGNLFAFPNKVEYECEEGYKLLGLKDRYCQASGEWSGRLPSCELVYCSVPSNPVNGRVRYSSLEYGSELQYQCNKGFALTHQQSRFCTSDGTWSNDEPECTEIRCKIPVAPAGGSFNLLGEPIVGSIVMYFCDEGKAMVGTPRSKCVDSGSWTFDPPQCLSTCKIPFLEHGEIGRYKTVRVSTYYGFRDSSQFVPFQVGENVKHSERVIVLCNPGFIPTTSSDASMEVLCNNGVWDKPMQCEESTCKVPFLEHGEIGRFHAVRVSDEYGLRDMWQFFAVQAGDIVKHSETVIVRCNSGFIPKGLATTSEDGLMEVLCNDGVWEKSMQCEARKCSGEPPSIENGYPVISNRSHGAGIFYKCNPGYKRVKNGSVKCNYGIWKGPTPVCGNTRCYLVDLNFPGLRKPKKNFIQSNSQFDIECEKGYKKIAVRTQIICNSGIWNIDNNPCEKETCDQEPPPMTNGKPTLFKRENGSRVDYECNDNFDLIGNSSVRCEAGEWIGQPPFCQKSVKNVEESPKSVTGYTHSESPEPENVSPSSKFADICYCTYDYPSDLVTATVGNKSLKPTERAQKGEIISFSCLHPGTHFYWPNGLRVHGALNLTCSECKDWQQNELPTCEPNMTGDSVIVYNDKMTILPGGAISISKTDIFEINCRNTHLQPQWYPRAKAGIHFSSSPLKDIRKTGYYSANMYIEEVKQDHIGKYKCYSIYEGDPDRSTILELKITEPEDRCPELSTNTSRGTFTIVYNNDRKINSAAYYTCKDLTQKIIGEASRICLKDGRWSGSFPYCEDITCLKHNKYNGLIVSYTNENKVNSVASFRCSDHSQRHLVGRNSSVCQYNGAWSSPTPACELLDIRCPPIDGKGIFDIRYSDHKKVNSTAEFYCKHPLQKVQGCSRMSCQPNGEWSGTFPTCVDAVTCVKFEDSADLIVSYSDGVRVGIHATFQCQPPSTLQGSTYAICRRNGTWSHSLPKCKGAVTCVKFEDSPYLVVSYSNDVRVGSIASFQCQPPNILLGSESARCRRNGTWTHPLPKCEAPTCSTDILMSSLPEGVVADMSAVAEEFVEFVEYGTSIPLLCEDGLYRIGRSSAKCEQRSKWEFGNVQCVPGCQLNKNVTTNSTVLINPVKEFYRFGDAILLSCPPGQQLSTSVVRVLCMGKTWSHDFPDCKENTQTSPSDDRETGTFAQIKNF